MKISEARLFYHFLLLIFILSLAHIIVHDFFCHEEFHHLISPIHHNFHQPNKIPLELVPPSPWQSSKVQPDYILNISSDFVPAIFHPPD
ncbi:MAG: hypothetical protein ACPLRA_03490 [Candidatus Saccharicenans sp.]